MSMNPAGNRAIEGMSDSQIKTMINWQDPMGLSPLHVAVQNKNLAHVQKLIKLGADCTLPNADGNTPLHFAAECGNLEILNVVADSTDDLDLQNNEGETPVILAAHAGSIGAVVSLTSMDKHVVPADTGILDIKSRTLLMHACVSGDIDLVRLILVNKEGNSQRTSISRVAINAVDTDGVTALMYVAMEGHWHLVSLLMLSKANIACKDVNGFSALHWAAAHGNSSTVAALIDCGASIHEEDSEQWTPLMHAVNEGSLETVQLLLENGASPDHTIGLAHSHAMHLTLCDAIRDEVVKVDSPIILSGRFIVSILRATDLYIDPSSVTNGKDDIVVYGVVQFKTSGDSDDSEMVGVTQGVRIPPLREKLTTSLEWNEPLTFHLKEKPVHPDCVLSIELFATRDHAPITTLFNTDHAAGEDEGSEAGSDDGDKRQGRMDQLYKDIQTFERLALDEEAKHAKAKLDEFHFSDLKKRWGQLTESRKRLEKTCGKHLPLPPVPASHFPCGSVTLSFSRLREVFRGKLVPFNRYPRCVDRGKLRFDLDFVPSLTVAQNYREAVEIPETPRAWEIPPIEGPDDLFDFTPEEEDKEFFATRAAKLITQSKQHYARWWASMSSSAVIGSPKRRKEKHTFKEQETALVKAVNIIAQSLIG